MARLVAETRTVAPALPAPVLARKPSAARRRLLQRYSRSAAADYARTWALKDNPRYGRLEPNDCTNFVSQALIAGGWQMVGGSCSDRKSDEAWWFGARDCWWVGGRPWPTTVKASFTWGGAQNLYNHMQTMQRGTAVTNPMELEPGDILQMDMGSGNYNAGRIGHSMVVTAKSDDDLFLSYHEPRKLDEPFSAIKGRYPGARWYPWKPSSRTPSKPPAYPGHSIVCPSCHDRGEPKVDLGDPRFDWEGSGLLRDGPQYDEEALRKWIEESSQTPAR